MLQATYEWHYVMVSTATGTKTVGTVNADEFDEALVRIRARRPRSGKDEIIEISRGELTPLASAECEAREAQI